MAAMEQKYLTERHLKGFDKYKYSSVDTSPLSIWVMHPFWNKTIKFFPHWIAPNVLTFTGFVLTVLNFLILAGVDYNFHAANDDVVDAPPVPRWMFMFCSISLFIAYTLDGIDGKQARRTGTTGPLGELFDHGLDSYSSVFIPLTLYSIFGRTWYSIPPVRFYFVWWNVLITFYVSHWEKYNTGVLFLPWGYDVSMLSCVFLLGAAGFGGHSCWRFILPGGITAGNVLEAVMYCTTYLMCVPVGLYNVYLASKNGTGKNRPLGEALRPLMPILVCFVLGTIWIFLSPSHIIERDSRAFLVLLGTIYSNICCRLIVAQMSNTRCDAFNWLLLPYACGILVALLVRNPMMELTTLYTLCAFTVSAHVHYGLSIVRELCDHFRINCFSITRPPAKRTLDNSQTAPS